MDKLHSHKKSRVAPAGALPVIQKLIDAYKVWHNFLPHFSKTSRYTLGERIDLLLIEVMESALLASQFYKTQKVPYVRQAIMKLDLLKFFLQIAWEIKALDNKKYIALSEKLNEIGKMLGGWLRQLSKENSTD
ncbi:MAG: hypothetical protein COT89_01880 [Candidatus Colwellbacteria bacterium CG10_big_fil_rev_8_21_14_0_10_42_22]|uniref:bAvd-like domain-containing protein n=1 Tax=Candidatus Colwellbacteria bacterium CG10_big_fil_rev_8_21_14_0_10_42_22 TaxID=1974540 RepID=A0A2H0VI43_9BACT|nr:MAG: hypothetical protein COT89_01880 [Candidatus Colwellbacteria bacterium CG10_big_fil_rev_8_21_14_0_10_42_22]